MLYPMSIDKIENISIGANAILMDYEVIDDITVNLTIDAQTLCRPDGNNDSFSLSIPTAVLTFRAVDEIIQLIADHDKAFGSGVICIDFKRDRRALLRAIALLESIKAPFKCDHSTIVITSMLIVRLVKTRLEV